VTGSLVLGVITGGFPGAAFVVGAGLLGGYTTFSTASVDAVLLAREGSHRAAAAYVAATVAGCVLAASAGLAAGLVLAPA
jgi:CrcB protein